MTNFNYYGRGAVMLSKWMKEYFNLDSPSYYIFEDRRLFELTTVSEDNSYGFVFAKDHAGFSWRSI